jgi:hypothetical protein
MLHALNLLLVARLAWGLAMAAEAIKLATLTPQTRQPGHWKIASPIELFRGVGQNHVVFLGMTFYQLLVW